MGMGLAYSIFTGRGKKINACQKGGSKNGPRLGRPTWRKHQGNKAFSHFFGCQRGPFLGPIFLPGPPKLNRMKWSLGGKFRFGENILELTFRPGRIFSFDLVFVPADPPNSRWMGRLYSTL